MEFPKKVKDKNKLVNFQMPENDHKKLVKKCKEAGWSVSGFLRFTINKYIQD